MNNLPEDQKRKSKAEELVKHASDEARELAFATIFDSALQQALCSYFAKQNQGLAHP